MGRVILISGQGGAGSTTLAAQTAEAARDEGFTVTEVDASGSEVGHGVASELPHVLGATLGALLLEAGADSILPEEWEALPTVSMITQWQRITDARRDGDVIVVDAGPLARLREFVQVPGVLLRLLDAALTPRMAMWRSTNGEGGVFDELSDARLTVLSWIAVLEAADTSVRVVSRPERASVDVVMRACAALSLLGLRIDGIVVSRFPRRKESWPAGVRREAERTLADLAKRSQGIAVWRSTSRRRPVPNGRSAVDPFPESGRAWALRENEVSVEASADGSQKPSKASFLMHLPMREPARSEVRVGVQGARLVAAFDGVVRWIGLPPVLQRCVAQEAERTDQGITVHWSPNADVWPATSGDEAS